MQLSRLDSGIETCSHNLRITEDRVGTLGEWRGIYGGEHYLRGTNIVRQVFWCDFEKRPRSSSEGV